MSMIKNAVVAGDGKTPGGDEGHGHGCFGGAGVLSLPADSQEESAISHPAWCI